MTQQGRSRRMSVRVRDVVAEVVQRQVKDPRLGMVTVTDARLTPDLREATVFWTAYGDDEVRDESARALESARGLIRSAVGRATGLKHTPSITFVLDAIPDGARQIDDLLTTAHAEDERVHALARGARPAGEAHPYRDELAGEAVPGGSDADATTRATDDPVVQAARDDAAVDGD